MPNKAVRAFQLIKNGELTGFLPFITYFPFNALVFAFRGSTPSLSLSMCAVELPI